MAQIQITDLPQALALTGFESVPIVQNGVTVQTTTGAISAQPNLQYTFLTATQQAGLPNSRYLAVGSGLQIIDGGAQGTMQVNLTGAASSLNSSGNGIQVKTALGTLTARSITVGTGLSITNGDGVAANPLIGLGAFLSNFQSMSGSTGLVGVNAGLISALSIAGTSGNISVASGDGSSGNPTINLVSTAVTPGTYTLATLTVDQFGRLTSASNGTITSLTSFSAGTTGLTPSVPTTGDIVLNGTLNIGHGGTNGTATPTAGGVSYGTGSAYGFTGAGTTGQVLTSQGASAPIWATVAASGTVTSVNATAGTGILVSGGPITTSGTLTITNTAPDQTVVLNNGTGINVTGTYPNFTISSTSSGGTVTNVTGTAPVNVANGTTTPVISMNVASNSTSGYLSSADWNTFNNKSSTNGTVTNVTGNGTVNGLTLNGTVTTTGNLTLGGTLDLSSPPAIGGNVAAAGTFTTLNATGQTSLGGSDAAPSFRATVGDNAPNTMWVEAKGASSADTSLYLGVGGTSSKPLLIVNNGQPISFRTTTIGGTGNEQLRVSHTASAVNYVQVTGNINNNAPSVISAGSDAAVGLSLSSKSTGQIGFFTNSANSNSRHLDITHTGSVVNRFTLTGSQTGFGVTLGLNGTDTNISAVFQSKGTGAIDLAAGSSGVNISNGGTVTAVTVTNGASNYTSTPTVTISAPTTAGGVQATGSVNMQINSGTSVVSGGTGYTNGDTITLVGGTFTTAATATVTASGGVVSAITIVGAGTYQVLPSNPISVTGGTGTGLTLNANWTVRSITIGTAGSGYVEQPTVTFSSGVAAAYATVGSDVTIKSIGANLLLNSISGTQIQASDIAGASSIVWWGFTGSSASTGNLIARAAGGGTNTSMIFVSKGTGAIQFATNNTGTNVQLQVSNTANAVNYVQVTGGATGSATGLSVSAQGSDGNVNLNINPKGTAAVQFDSIKANYIQIKGAATGSAPSIALVGTDTNIDLTLTPKGTGRVNITTSIKPKVNSAANVTSPLAWDSTSYDEYAITALANALTINADANASPADGQKMMFRFKDNGTARALTWTTGSTNSFRVVGVTLPTTTVASKLVYIGCIYNAADSRWDAVAVSQEA